MFDVMLDLETLSTRSNAAIVSIGAVFFDPEREELGRSFYANIDPESCQNAGLHISGSTVMWWMQQSDEARKSLMIEQTSLHTALNGFAFFLENRRDIRIWGNGADFDNAILGNAYEAANISRPWSYSKNRCYRTMKNTFPVPENTDGDRLRHHALNDAVAQALHLTKIYKVIRTKA